MKLKIKDQLPDTEIFQLVDGEPQKSKLRETIGNGKVVLFGLPGAFTSTCSKLHLPGFVANADKIKAKGIENIFCLSVNDPYVMNGWGEINNTGDKIKIIKPKHHEKIYEVMLLDGFEKNKNLFCYYRRPFKRFRYKRGEKH